MLTIAFCNSDQLYYAYDQNNCIRIKARTIEAMRTAVKNFKA